MEAFCVNCRCKKEMRDQKTVSMKNGKPATQGVCPTCGTKMFRIGGINGYPNPAKVNTRPKPVNKIYLITTVYIGDPVWQNGFLVYRSRSVGWYEDLEGAKKAVETNACDIYEVGHYDHCVIEEMLPGLYACAPKEWWYRWEGDAEHGGYKPTTKPKGLENIVNFGIG